jgi:hypothetical protein
VEISADVSGSALPKVALKGSDGGMPKTPRISTLTDLTGAPNMKPVTDAAAAMKTRQKIVLANSAYQHLARLMRPSKPNRNWLSVSLPIVQPVGGLRTALSGRLVAWAGVRFD